MTYKVIMGGAEKVELIIDANSVFDAINIAAERVNNPDELELIEASPIATD